MKINQDFAMSVAMILFLKKRKNTDYLQASEVATALDFSVGYLQKVIQMLSKQGIVECKRGRIGGVRIRAKVITLLDLWKATCGGLDYRNPALPVMKEPLKAFSDSMSKVVVYRKLKT
ncbi:MAG TPA: Rrf2 family transcriptional regulator [Sedimentisphaerales bacterium]|nr:Rrf2 family transcriptional regulator [Sedimentisphaerales bacterium]